MCVCVVSLARHNFRPSYPVAYGFLHKRSFRDKTRTRSVSHFPTTVWTKVWRPVSAGRVQRGAGLRVSSKLDKTRVAQKMRCRHQCYKQIHQGRPRTPGARAPNRQTIVGFRVSLFASNTRSRSVAARRCSEAPAEEPCRGPSSVAPVSSRGALLRAQKCTFSHFGRLGSKWARA